MSLSEIQTTLKGKLRQFQDFPSKGILFEDIMPIFQDPKAFQLLLDGLKLHLKDKKVDVIVGLDARGFLFGPALALQLGAAFVPVRKQGKLPGPTVQAVYEKEYGQDIFEIQADAIKPGQSVVIVDDIIATGGSASAAGELVTKIGGSVTEYLFILELLFLKGRDKLNAPVFTLLAGQ
ncbi:adenine phosphoribosyltransferase APT1 [Sugiyamaella lignohabitans]|uniref:adenine phosphoribosyltransferase n=1 Tax=Sugiyamaella lignohabitans TaxID=796027 RepID=A0A161HFC1_9ASCO|nr:adenine phosphoribosyltransferase APT1 [Sugiyamaella lignohabitans]ANB14200.1 adenine phosphoribosyltransferase APT1 [Sugiyamaella lignohabitans]